MADGIDESPQKHQEKEENPMIYTSLAVLALSASAAVSPFSNLIHLHPHAASADTRVSVTLVNDSNAFRDVKVAGQVYTVLSHRAITIKAPIGTVVYAASKTLSYKRGDVMMEVNPKLDKQKIVIN